MHSRTSIQITRISWSDIHASFGTPDSIWTFFFFIVTFIINKQTKPEIRATCMRQWSSLGRIRTDKLLFYPVCCWPGEGWSAQDKTIRGVRGQAKRGAAIIHSHCRHTAALHYKYQPEKECPDKRNRSPSSLWDEQLIPAACPLRGVCQRTSAAALCQRGANKAALREKPPLKRCAICRLVTARVTSVTHVQPLRLKEQQSRLSIKWTLHGWPAEMIRFHVGLGVTRSGGGTEQLCCHHNQYEGRMNIKVPADVLLPCGENT